MSRLSHMEYPDGCVEDHHYDPDGHLLAAEAPQAQKARHPLRGIWKNP